MVESIKEKRIALALSGGGFRASFFHIGVLSELARSGLLKHVTAISTVSGGSIIGAYYYLELQRHRNRLNRDLVDQDYIEIIENISIDFFKKVNRNLRNKFFFHHLGDLFTRNKSLAENHNLVELLNKYFFDDFSFSNKNVTMDQLCQSEGLPKLIINSTNINFGKVCCFTSDLKDAENNFFKFAEEISKHQANKYKFDYKKLTIGHAVAASSCVPGLFPPMNILLDKSILSFVDGGVIDNLGISALMEEDYEEIIVSDGSLHIDQTFYYETSQLDMLMRTNDILMDQLKENSIRSNNLSKKIILVSIRSGLSKEPPSFKLGSMPLTDYGVDQSVQYYLSKIRTDLDTFTNIEAESLMVSGMLIANQTVSKESLKSNSSNFTYSFQKKFIEENMKNPSEKYLKYLNAGSKKINRDKKYKADPYKLYITFSKGFNYLNFFIISSVLTLSLLICFVIVKDIYYIPTILINITMTICLLSLFALAFNLYIPLFGLIILLYFYLQNKLFCWKSNRFYKK